MSPAQVPGPSPVPGAEAYARSFDERVVTLLDEAPRRVPGYAARLADAGLDAGAAGGATSSRTDPAVLDRLPVISKDDLVALQASSPPFGGLLAPGAAVARVFQSPGPLYEPELARPDHWGWAPALAAAGFERGDVVLDTFGYHLTPAGAMFESAALALGCVVVPAGVGGFELQVQAAATVGATAFVGLPSYLKALLDRAEQQGVTLPFRRAFFTAEPLPPSLRQWLQARVPVLRQGYGTAEAGNLGYECEREAGLHLPEDRYVQVCDLRDGQPLWAGEEGQVVVSLLEPDYPLVRLGTGDLSALMPGECGCGRPTPRLVGWLGRVGEAVKVRGMFVHPRQVSSLMAAVPGVRAFRLVVDRVDHKDTLRFDVVASGSGDSSDSGDDDVAARVRARVREGLRFDVAVNVVEALDPDGPVLVDERTWD